MKKCKIEGCINKYHAKGYCKKHYKRYKKHGNATKRTIYDKNEIIKFDKHYVMFLYNKNCKKVAETIFDSNIDEIKKHKWHLTHFGYVVSDIGNDKIIFLHKIVNDNIPKNKQCDHIDGNKLNNLKSNLRLVSPSQNSINKRIRSDNKSGRVGVCWAKNIKKWHAEMRLDGKHLSLGYYNDFEDAVKARQQAELKYHGEYSPKENRKSNLI